MILLAEIDIYKNRLAEPNLIGCANSTQQTPNL
jgi:hypothetical protein